MGRLFTIDISFREKNHTALVCTTKEEGSLTYQVQFRDAPFIDSLPGGKLISINCEEWTNFKELAKEPNHELLDCIKNAVEHHLASS